MKRTHDEIYANEDKNAAIKDSFKMIAKNIEDFSAARGERLVIGDLGCARGVLPDYLKSRFPDHEVIGFEYLDELLEVARIDFPHIEFRQMDVTSKDSLSENSLDIITLAGVLSIFDDVENVIHNMLHWARPGGRILIFNPFNPYDIDVFIKYKHSKDYPSGELESGWNIVSQATVANILRQKGVEDFSFSKFEISVDIEPRKDDPLRGWTEKGEDGKRFIMNGLHLRRPTHLLEINV